MTTLFPQNFDLFVAGGLIIIAIVLFLLSRMSVLPKKSFPYVAIAIAGVFGATILRSWLLNKQKNDLTKRQQELEKKEKELAALKINADGKELDLREALQKIEDERAAYARQIVENAVTTKTERDETDKLSRDELSIKAAEILKNL